MAAAFVLRLAAADGDLWLDEIWSLNLVREAGSPLRLLTAVHHDNNHLLNSLYLALLPGITEPVALRALAIVCGTVTVALLWLAARAHGFGAGLIAAALGAASYPLVLYSSEARGYAPALMFALAAFLALRRWLRDGGVPALLLFWLAAALGFLAHLSYAQAYVALLVYSLWALAPRGWRNAARGAGLLHLPVVAVVAAYGWISVRHFAIGGGDEQPILRVAWQAVEVLLGLPGYGAIRWVLLALLLGLIVIGWVRQWQDDRGQAVLLACAALLAPVLFALIQPSKVTFFRYFLVAFPFACILLATGIAGVAASGLRNVALALGVLAIAAQIPRVAPLLRDGRGHYCAAVRAIGDGTRESLITVGSDHDFRNRVVLDYYARCLPAGKTLAYVPQETWRAAGPAWLIVHSQEADFVPAVQESAAGSSYGFRGFFPTGSDSGWHWAVYRREN